MGKIVRAKLRYLHTPPRKAGVVAALIRGKMVSEGREILRFCPKRAAGEVLKAVESATANAKENLNLVEDKLRIRRVLVGPGPTLKRGQPVSRGRWHPILKRTTHITIELEEINGKQKAKK